MRSPGIILMAMLLLPAGISAQGVTDTITYRACIAADSASVALYGGRDCFTQKLDGFFEKVTRYWNEAGTDRFTHYYRFEPRLGHIYNSSSSDEPLLYGEGGVGQTVDTERYDLFLVMDLIRDFPDEKPGAYCGDLANGFSAVTHKRYEEERDPYFDSEETFRTIVHELGHYRGVTDVYATQMTNNQKNPVADVTFEPMPCIMRQAADGLWSEYAVSIIEDLAEYRVLSRDCPVKGYFKNLFCDRIRFNITAGGRPARGAKVNLYGKRTNYYDVIAPPAISLLSDRKGVAVVEDVKNLYCEPKRHGYAPAHLDIPYGRWFNFLVELEYRGAKKYLWIPEYDAQMQYFSEDPTTLTINVEIK